MITPEFLAQYRIACEEVADDWGAAIALANKVGDRSKLADLLRRGDFYPVPMEVRTKIADVLEDEKIWRKKTRTPGQKAVPVIQRFYDAWRKSGKTQDELIGFLCKSFPGIKEGTMLNIVKRQKTYRGK